MTLNVLLFRSLLASPFTRDEAASRARPPILLDRRGQALRSHIACSLSTDVLASACLESTTLSAMLSVIPANASTPHHNG
jgi:hypothetical protein